MPAQLAAGDVVRGPYAGAAASPIHPADFAAVAVAALTQDGHAGKAYHVTGPESLTHREQFELIGRAHGRDLRYEELDPAAARAAISPYAPADCCSRPGRRIWTTRLRSRTPSADDRSRGAQRPEWAEAYPVPPTR